MFGQKKKKKYFFSKFSSKVKPFCKVYFDVNKKNHGMCGCLVPHWVECVYACVCLSSQSIFPKVMFFCKVYFGVNKKKNNKQNKIDDYYLEFQHK